MLRPRAPLLYALFLSIFPLACGRAARADDFGDARKAFRDAMRAEDWQTRGNAFLPLLAFDGPDAVDEIMKALAREKNPAVRLRAIEALAQLRSELAIAELADAARDAKGQRSQDAVMALAAHDGAPGGEVLVDLVHGKDPAFAAQAALALGRKHLFSTVPHLVDLLARDEWQLRAAAARALLELAGPVPGKPVPGQPPDPWLPAGFPGKDLLGPVTESLARSEGSERRFLIDLLQRISKQDFGYDVEAWRAYARGDDPQSIVRNPTNPPYIFGVPIYGRRVVLLFDGSLCSDEPHPFTDHRRLQEICKVPGARDVPWYELRTRKQLYVAHMTRLINDLPGEVKFDLVVFTGEVRPTFGRLTPMNAGTRSKTLKLLEDYRVANGVDTQSGFREALDISGSKESVAWSLGPDEVIFISCSIPWLAPETDQDVIGAEVALKAGWRMVPIHSIGVGSHPFVLMRIVSPATGGVYVNLTE